MRHDIGPSNSGQCLLPLCRVVRATLTQSGSSPLVRISERTVFYVTTDKSYTPNTELFVDYGDSYTRDYDTSCTREDACPAAATPGVISHAITLKGAQLNWRGSSVRTSICLRFCNRLLVCSHHA